MKVVATGSQMALGVIFLIFGLNGFLMLIPVPPPEGMAATFLEVLIESRYLHVVKAIEIGAALLLLSNRYVPLALLLLAPVIVNIALYHLLLEPTLLGGAILLVALWSALAWAHRETFRPLFARGGERGLAVAIGRERA